MHWDKTVGVAGQIVAKQTEFRSILTKSPEKAAKLVKECEVLAEQEENNYRKNIQPNVDKAEVSFTAIRTAMKSAQKVLEDQRVATAKARASIA